MSAKKIVIDGKTYQNVDEMPEDVRRNYEEAMRNFGTPADSAANPIQTLSNVLADSNNNGMPDVMENRQVVNLSGGTTFVVDGKVFKSLDELPPGARAKYEQAMGAMDKNRNGVPDFLEGMTNVSDPPSPTAMTATRQAVDTTRHASHPSLSSSPAIAPDTSNGWMFALAGLFVLMICALGALGVWYFFLR
jgi:hypothetical protein